MHVGLVSSVCLLYLHISVFPLPFGLSLLWYHIIVLQRIPRNTSDNTQMTTFPLVISKTLVLESEWHIFTSMGLELYSVWIFSLTVECLTTTICHFNVTEPVIIHRRVKRFTFYISLIYSGWDFPRRRVSRNCQEFHHLKFSRTFPPSSLYSFTIPLFNNKLDPRTSEEIILQQILFDCSIDHCTSIYDLFSFVVCLPSTSNCWW